MIWLPEEDPIVVGHVINYLYTKSVTIGDIQQIVDTYLSAGHKYRIPHMKTLLLQKIAAFQVADNLKHAESFFQACSKVYKQTAQTGEDFRNVFRNVALGVFASSIGSMNWPQILGPYLSHGGAMADDLFFAQHSALKACNRKMQGSTTKLVPTQPSQQTQQSSGRDGHYLKTLKREMQAAQDSIARIRRNHDQNHRGCRCAGSGSHR